MRKLSYLKLRHLPCNIYDFNADRHRFVFEFNGKRGEVWCTGKCNVYFTVGVPDYIQKELMEEIWKRIDRDEMKWVYPREAYKIADRYCVSEFIS